MQLECSHGHGKNYVKQSLLDLEQCVQIVGAGFCVLAQGACGRWLPGPALGGSSAGADNGTAKCTSTYSEVRTDLQQDEPAGWKGDLPKTGTADARWQAPLYERACMHAGILLHLPQSLCARIDRLLLIITCRLCLLGTNSPASVRGQ